MDVRDLNKIKPDRLRIANLTHIAYEEDVRGGIPNPRPAQDTFECWRAPWTYPFSTVAQPWIEVDRHDVHEVILKHFGERGADRGLFIVFDGNEAAIKAKLAAWETAHPGEKPAATKSAAEIARPMRPSLLGDGVPMYLAAEEQSSGSVASGRGRASANASGGGGAIYDRAVRGTTPSLA